MSNYKQISALYLMRCMSYTPSQAALTVDVEPNLCRVWKSRAKDRHLDFIRRDYEEMMRIFNVMQNISYSDYTNELLDKYKQIKQNQ